MGAGTVTLGRPVVSGGARRHGSAEAAARTARALVTTAVGPTEESVGPTAVVTVSRTALAGSRHVVVAVHPVMVRAVRLGEGAGRRHRFD
ncbi:hypothetical protein ACFY2Z_33260, partial [Streptomyces sp. NPDC001222]|uniref:hypothetical protein n=1 Tax=Streptomyces sp. NPDC001222 TaxID=3364548 RepID=UPI0036C704FC